MNVNKAVALRISELLLQKGMTQNALANALDITPTSVYRWFAENNPTTPSWKNLEKILEIFQITPIQFLQGFDLPNLTPSQVAILEDWFVLDDEERNVLQVLIDKFKKNHVDQFSDSTKS